MLDRGPIEFKKCGETHDGQKCGKVYEGETCTKCGQPFRVDHSQRIAKTMLYVPGVYGGVPRRKCMVCDNYFSTDWATCPLAEAHVLFRVSPGCRPDLEQGQISESLRQSFADHGIPLSHDVMIDTLRATEGWLINDREGKNRFLVIPDTDGFNVSQHHPSERTSMLLTHYVVQGYVGATTSPADDGEGGDTSE